MNYSVISLMCLSDFSSLLLPAAAYDMGTLYTKKKNQTGKTSYKYIAFSPLYSDN